jgi:hypothetical protein
MQEKIRDLRHRKDEDEVVEQLDRRRPLLLALGPSALETSHDGKPTPALRPQYP